jgi:hypothetical protein
LGAPVTVIVVDAVMVKPVYDPVVKGLAAGVGLKETVNGVAVTQAFAVL